MLYGGRSPAELDHRVTPRALDCELGGAPYPICTDAQREAATSMCDDKIKRLPAVSPRWDGVFSRLDTAHMAG